MISLLNSEFDHDRHQLGTDRVIKTMNSHAVFLVVKISQLKQLKHNPNSREKI